MKNIASLVLNYSTLLGGGRSSRVNGRTLRVKNFSKIALCAVLLLAAGCKGKEQPIDPYVDPGTTENPQWKITVDTTDMTSSMTAIIQVSFAKSEGTLAAFTGNECCGIGEYMNGLYWLYISPASEQGGNVQLKFYSPDLKRIFVAKETFSFVNDAHLGSVNVPYTPTWDVAK